MDEMGPVPSGWRPKWPHAALLVAHLERPNHAPRALPGAIRAGNAATWQVLTGPSSESFEATQRQTLAAQQHDADQGDRNEDDRVADDRVGHGLVRGNPPKCPQSDQRCGVERTDGRRRRHHDTDHHHNDEWHRCVVRQVDVEGKKQDVVGHQDVEPDQQRVDGYGDNQLGVFDAGKAGQEAAPSSE